MTEARAVMLVARRELTERIRGRAWQLSTLFAVVIVAVIAVLTGVLGGDDPERHEVGAHGAESVAIANAARAAAPRLDAQVEVRRFESAEAARAAVRDEEMDAAVVAGTLVAREEPPDELEEALQAGTRTVRGAAILRREGLSAAEAGRALNPPPLEARTLDEGDDDDRPGVALVASFLLYTQLVFYGLAVASGVVEEKASRVVEVLLSTIPPRSLLAGKIIGIGLLGLMQLFAVGVVGLAVAAASGALELDGPSLLALGVALVWFLFGYALYACLYAVSGVIVSRQEDLQSSSTPLTVILILAYLLIFPAIDNPGSALATIASLVPFTSPIVMPARIALGEVGALEIVASLGLLVAGVALLVPLGARIYEGAILRMGKPLKPIEAWRTARA